jgi:CDP-ribitol ribitolphosphotransferase
MATSHYFIVDDYYFPIYTIKPRKKTEIIQLWHAAGAFKKFGHSIVGKAFGPTNGYLKYINIHSNYTKVIVSSKEVIPFYAEAFQMPSANIYPLGLPRTDYFFDLKSHQQLKNQFYHDYPELKEKKVILYAPTFRSKGQNQNLLDYFIDLNVLRDSLGSDYALLIHLHPYVDKKLHFTAQFDGFVYQMQDNYSIEEILILSDLLITDYSSIIFDFSILNKPIGFYARDLESYTKIRDFYFDYENFVPGPIFKNTMKLTHWIKEENFELEKIQEFRKRFMKDCDGRVSQRVVEQIFNN